MSQKAIKRKWKKQRAERGYSDEDIYEISSWFFSIMPKMIKDLKKKTDGFPFKVKERYYKVFEEELKGVSKKDYLLGNYDEALKEQINKESFEYWQGVLDDMIYHFNECNEYTCSYKNQYANKYFKAFDEHMKKYGFLGEKVKGNHVKENEDGKVYYLVKNPYHMSDIDEYKEIYKLYHDEQKKIEEYINTEKKIALHLFVEHLADLNC